MENNNEPIGNEPMENNNELIEKPKKPKKPTYKKPFEAADGTRLMLIAFALMLGAQLVFSFILMPFQDNDTVYMIVNLVAMVAFQAVYLAVYLIYTHKRGIASSFSPRNKLTIWSALSGALLAIVCIFCFMGPAYLFESLLIKSGYPSQGIEFEGVFPIILMVFATVVAAPICEETVFRSAFLSGATRIRSDEVGTCFLCGICFALMHINPEQTVYQFLLGSTAAYLVLRTKSVIPSMVLHATSNAFALVLDSLPFGQAIDNFYGQSGDVIWIMLITCILLPAVGGVIIYFLCKLLHKIEMDRYPTKFGLPKIVWFDETTKEPVFEGGEVPEINDENRIIRKGFNPFTGEPVLVDRAELQRALSFEYTKSYGVGGARRKSYRLYLGIYIGLTIAMWLMTLGSGYLLNLIGPEVPGTQI